MLLHRRRALASRTATAPRRSKKLVLETLEERQVLSTLLVSSLASNGPGTLRAAILQANAQPGADTIDFAVSGTIRVTGAALPAITDRLTIDGTTAPGYAGSPVVTVDFSGTRGLDLAPGSDASVVRGLALVRASNAGLTLDSSFNAIQGNDIGILPNGQVAANRGDGIRINPSSHDNLIGRSDPVTGINYYSADHVSMQPVSGWQGIRQGSLPGDYLITGTSGANGLLYVGPISGLGGTSYAVNVPNATTSSVYGPNLLANGGIQLVGSYKDGGGTVNGFLFQGTVNTLNQAAGYTTIDYPGATYTYVHSTMGGLAVGNADGPEGSAPIGTGHAFLYDIAHASLTDIVYPGATTTTASGIWDNANGQFTIAGGYSMPGETTNGLSHAFLVDYDASSATYSHWTPFDYPNGVVGTTYITHFEGISSVEKGVYTLAADSLETGSSNPMQGSWVTVRRNTDQTFGSGKWVDLNVPGIDPTTNITSANSVVGNEVVGIVIGTAGTASYQAQVNVGFQLSNVISGNKGNGVGLYGSSHNQVAMNFIGTDPTGTLARSNCGNGILITQGAADNLIGGEATGANDPTASVFARPPQGNLISGNAQNGVLINAGSTRNQLSGNFIGTMASGNLALGNRLDGVAIVGANGNSLLGCTDPQNPFVFYNVISGNRGNGLRITNSNDTIVHANFLGAGANNASVVANHGDGLLVSGTSAHTRVGGVIPLGNVISGNDQNGIEVRDRASDFVSFNTFAGVFAFSGAAPNKRDGILITSTGGGILIRTSIVSGNLGNGIEIGGNATGVQVTDTAVGTNTSIQWALPNGGDGILMTGHAHNNAIGGFQPSVEPQVTLSSNRGYGIRVTGSAHDNTVYNTDIGTGALGNTNLGNTLGGVYLGAGTSNTTIGGPAGPLKVLIRYNYGNGVTIQCSKYARIEGNTITDNLGYGVRAKGNCAGGVIQGNTIAGNSSGNVNLQGSVGISYTP